jgi:hypothetical protein
MGIAVAWNAAEWVTLCVNRKGIHPGAHIALDFLISGGLIAGAAFDIIDGIWSHPASKGMLTATGVLVAIAG